MLISIICQNFNPLDQFKTFRLRFIYSKGSRGAEVHTFVKSSTNTRHRPESTLFKTNVFFSYSFSKTFTHRDNLNVRSRNGPVCFV